MKNLFFLNKILLKFTKNFGVDELNALLSIKFLSGSTPNEAYYNAINN